MNSKKSGIAVIIFILAGLVAVLGIIQLALYIPPQIEMIDEALLAGVTDEEVWNYYKQTFIPQVINFLILSLGFASVLFACGIIYLKPVQVVAVQATDESDEETHEEEADEEEADIIVEEIETEDE